MTLVERDRELEILTRLFADCMLGQGKIALISGTVGAGKTALLRAFQEVVTKSDAFLLNASASRAERGMQMGVMSQLFSGVELRYHDNEILAEFDILSCVMNENDFETGTQVTTPLLQRIWKKVQDLAGDAPVVIAVDDVDYADAASLECLLHLARRLGSARVLLILNECTPAQPGYTLLSTELIRHTQCVHIPLQPLSPVGIATLLATHLEHRAANFFAVTYHRVSGGNPRLVQALLEDSASVESGELAVGDAYKKSIVGSLNRCETTTSNLVRAIAVLGESATPELLGRLFDFNTSTTIQIITAMNATGILEAGRFRHDASRMAVLDWTPPDERLRLHSRVAHVLYEQGAAATHVAQHVLAARLLDVHWAVPVLQEAAEQALHDNDVRLAISCLRLAHSACTDDRQRTVITTALARAEWQVDPGAVSRHLPALVTSLRQSCSDSRDSITAISYLLWYGRPDEAKEALDRLSSDPTSLDSESMSHLEAISMWLSYSYPDLLGDSYAGRRDAASKKVTSAAVTPHLQAAAVLAHVLNHGADDDVLNDAEQVLQRHRLHNATLVPALAALAAYMYAGRFNTAIFWCDLLLEKLDTSSSVTSHALLSAVRATIAVQRGDASLAEKHARNALTSVSPKAWGIAIGVPLAAMVSATIATGAYNVAETYLALPVPEAMFRTPFGLHYLHARGQYHLATGHFRAALGDFQACGDLMDRWKLDLSTIIPWRLNAAQAYLGLGNKLHARDLLIEQLSIRSHGNHRTRGISLRLLASISAPSERLTLLKEAVGILQLYGDRAERALALADLNHIDQQFGEKPEVQVLAREEYRLARQGGTEPAQRALPQDVTAAEQDITNPRSVGLGPIMKLSDAERRVATLAAKGYTNRKIAKSLFVTVSTVEQHLTRVYRKLKVKGRSHLMSALWHDVADSKHA